MLLYKPNKASLNGIKMSEQKKKIYLYWIVNKSVARRPVIVRRSVSHWNISICTAVKLHRAK